MTTRSEDAALQTVDGMPRALPPLAAGRATSGAPSSSCTGRRSTPAGTAGWPSALTGRGSGRLRDGPARPRPDGGEHRHRPVRRRARRRHRARATSQALAPGDRDSTPACRGSCSATHGLDHRAGQPPSGTARDLAGLVAVRADRGRAAPGRHRHRPRGGGRRPAPPTRRSTPLGPFNERFEPARTRYDWLSRDAAEVDAYIADPLSGDEMPLTVGLRGRRLRAAVRAATPEARRRAARRPARPPAVRRTGPRRRDRTPCR